MTPSGGLLRSCLERASLDPGDAYLTNAVQHFTFRRDGKRRIHQRPNTAEIEACHPWLAAELMFLRPAAVVALGAAGDH